MADGTQYEVIAPDGTRGTVSEADREKVSGGYKLTGRIQMHAPNGDKGFVEPKDLQEATKAGYQTTPKTRLEKSATEGPRGAWDALKGMVPPDPTGGHPLLGPLKGDWKAWLDTDKSKFDPKGPGTTYSNMTRELPPDLPGVTGKGGSTIGRGLYRGASELAPLAGGSAENMEEASGRGDTSGVATQAGVPIAGALLGVAGKRYGPAIKAKVVTPITDAVGGVTRRVLAGPVEGEYGQSAIAQKALKPSEGTEQQFQKDMKGSRAYLSGSKDMADLQSRVGKAKPEIWDQYDKGMKKFGSEKVNGPDGKPTTYSALEARRLELSAQLNEVRSKDPATRQTAFQKGLNEADLDKENKAVTSTLDKRFAQQGINAPLIRETHGSVKGIERQVSGRNTLSEEPKPYGAGKVADADLTKLGNIPKAVGEGASDIRRGRPWWKGKPTDVGIREGFTTGADKPNFNLPANRVGGPRIPSTSPSLASRLFKGPTGPAEQVGGAPGSNTANFPDRPTGQAPEATTSSPTTSTLPAVAGGEFPNWPPKTPDWTPPSTAPPIPDAKSTLGNPTPYDPPSTQGPPAMKGGLTDTQVAALPSATRDALTKPVPPPGTFSPGARADVTPTGAPLPSSAPAGVVPPISGEPAATGGATVTTPYDDYLADKQRDAEQQKAATTGPIADVAQKITSDPRFQQISPDLRDKVTQSFQDAQKAAVPPTMPSLSDVQAANKPTNLGAGLPSEGIVSRTPTTGNAPLGADTTVKSTGPPPTMPAISEPASTRTAPGVRQLQREARNNAATMRSGGTYDESTTEPPTMPPTSATAPPTAEVTTHRPDAPPTPKVRDFNALRGVSSTPGMGDLTAPKSTPGGFRIGTSQGADTPYTGPERRASARSPPPTPTPAPVPGEESQMEQDRRLGNSPPTAAPTTDPSLGDPNTAAINTVRLQRGLQPLPPPVGPLPPPGTP